MVKSGELPPIRIEPENEWVWCGDRRLDLMPKAFAVLRHLVENPQRLVTKDELMTAVWSDTVVSEAALTSCIRDLRRALDDDSRMPRYIETVHRRGFRFIGRIGRAAVVERSVAPLVGRDDELARLDALCETALGGQRRVVFVTGEPGIGKTSLVESFLARLDGVAGLRIGRGQCIEQYGAGETYLPVLEALGRLGRDDEALVRVLRQYAPTWLAQLPALLSDEDLDAVRRRSQESTRDRMLRELIEAIDALCAEGPLVLLLEDLHWSDSATIELLAMLARRRDAARLLIVGTYRPGDVAARSHPLESAKQELQLHDHCEELALGLLSETAVGEYVAARLSPAARVPGLVPILHRNTSGNPLFLVNLVDHLIAHERVRRVGEAWALAVPLDAVAADVPQTLWQMVDAQLERLTPSEQAVLAVASVAGSEFSTALAVVDGITAEDAERCCAALARRGALLRALGAAEWPDGTVAGRYGFTHALYQNAAYARMPIGRRVGLHARIGARLEQAHGARAGEVAGELAMHFEQGRDLERAVQYRRLAAENALRQHGNREAASHATRALELLATFPASPERRASEVALQTILGAALVPLGSATPAVAKAFEGMRDSGSDALTELFPSALGMFRYHISRGEVTLAREPTAQLVALAAAHPDPDLRLGAHYAAGATAFHAGDCTTALAELEQGVAVDAALGGQVHEPTFWGGLDAGVTCAVYAAWALWILGHVSEAVTRMEAAMERARVAEHPFNRAWAAMFAATFHACRRDVAAVREWADVSDRVASEQGFELLRNLGGVMRGWALSESGEGDGAAEIAAGVAVYRENGGGIGLPTYLGFLAQAHLRHGRVEEGLAVVEDAVRFVGGGGAHYWDAELLRLRGELRLAGLRRGRQRDVEAEAFFARAVDVARGQRARSLELRATISVARTSRGPEARSELAKACEWFGDGVDAVDLTEARTLLEERGASRR